MRLTLSRHGVDMAIQVFMAVPASTLVLEIDIHRDARQVGNTERHSALLGCCHRTPAAGDRLLVVVRVHASKIVQRDPKGFC
jgi:hypothetical protein